MKKLFIIFLILLWSGIAGATNFYFADDGSDTTNDCQTFGTPCQTLEKLESLIASTGAGSHNYLLKCGDVWDNATKRGSVGDIDIGVSGITVGAYIAADGSQVTSENQCPGDLPKITRGSDAWPGPKWVDSETGTTSVFHINEDSVTIENIWFYDIYSVAVLLTSVTDNCIIQNNIIERPDNQGILGSGSDNLHILNNRFIEAEYRWAEDADCRWDVGPGAAVTCNDGCDDFLVDGNTIVSSYGEGIGAYNYPVNGYSNSTVISDNYIGATRSGAIHVTGWDSISIQRNMIVMHDNGGDKTFFRGSNESGSYQGSGVCTGTLNAGNGIDLQGAANPSPFTHVLTLVENNVVIGRNLGIGLDFQGTAGTKTLTAVRVYSNIAIDNLKNYMIDEDDAGTVTLEEIKNNISYIINSGGVDVGTSQDIDNATDVDYNSWMSDPGGNWTGANDIIGAPGIVTTSGYYWPDDETVITFDDVKLAGSTSAAYDQGDTLGDPYDEDYEGVQRPQGAAYDMGPNELLLYVYNVSPADNATAIPIDQIITWTNPSGAVTLDLYFDDVNPPVDQIWDGVSPATTYDPTLVVNEEYFFRIDVTHAGGTQTGTVYSFETVVDDETPPLVDWNTTGMKWK